MIDPTRGACERGPTVFRWSGKSAWTLPPPAKQGLAVLVETSSCDPALGYAVPPGAWDLQVVTIANGRRLLTPKLPLIVTAGRIAPASLETWVHGPGGNR